MVQRKKTGMIPEREEILRRLIKETGMYQGKNRNEIGQVKELHQ
jgi:hypothetical protein